MSSLSSLYIKASTLKTLLDTLEKKQQAGIELTLSIQDESNGYGQNLSAFVSQTKEQRDAGAKRYYVGNGKVFWTDGKIQTGVKTEENQNTTTANGFEDDIDNLPF